MEKQVIGKCVLYRGDCLEIMPTLDAVDAVVTDSPYKLTSGGKNGDFKGGKLSKENYNNNGEIVACDVDWPDFMPVIYDTLKEQAHAYFMANNRHVKNALNSAEKAGFRFHNLLVWNKGTATPNRWYMKNCEFTAFVYKGGARPINDCGSVQLAEIPNILGAAHPTEKPVELMRLYIENSSGRGQTILDPFMGSGTTGVACVKTGRSFIGIELDTEYFDIACKRIEDAYKQPDLFVEPPKKAEQVNMF